jgi:hypothetical protein
MQRVMPTSFRASSFKTVWRCADPTLVRRAVRQAKRWARFETRYDVERIDMKMKFRDMHRALQTPKPEMLALIRKQFDSSGKYLWDSLSSDNDGWTYVGKMVTDSVQEDGYKGKVAGYQQQAEERRKRYIKR